MANRKVALITGGSRGIGAAIVRALSEAGYATVFSYRDRAQSAEDLAQVVRAKGREVLALRADVSVPAQADALISETLKRFDRIDALINNAGVHVPHVRFADLTDEDWERVMTVNLTAPFRITRAVLPHMRKQGGGHIINLSSNVTQRMPPGYGVYAISKAGIEAFTRILSKEEGRYGIRVNCVGPGPIHTDMLRESMDIMGKERAETFIKSFALGRMGEPEEIASVVAFLLSEAASYMTGQVVYVNGGGMT